MENDNKIMKSINHIKTPIMKKILLYVILFMTCLGLKAQQDAMLSQYMFNGLFLNPAYAGSHDYASASLVHRRQWTAFEGAPVTSVLAVDGPLLNKKIGLGFMLGNDQIGVTNQTDFYANYAYHIPFRTGVLALGLKLGASQYYSKLSSLTVWDHNDEIFMGDRKSALLPKAGCGVYYYAERYYAGVSVPTLWAYDSQRSFNFNLEESSNLRRHYYLTGGYVFFINPVLKLKPSVLLKYQPSAPLQADFNINALIQDKFWVGASFRTGDAVAIILEYQINKQLRVGYAFDYTVSKLNPYSGGTHEVMLGYDFGKYIKVRTPRYF